RAVPECPRGRRPASALPGRVGGPRDGRSGPPAPGRPETVPGCGVRRRCRRGPRPRGPPGLQLDPAASGRIGSATHRPVEGGPGGEGGPVAAESPGDPGRTGPDVEPVRRPGPSETPDGRVGPDVRRGGSRTAGARGRPRRQP